MTIKAVNENVQHRRQSKCRLCRVYPKYNADTIAAMKEADEIMSAITDGRRRPLSLEAMLQQIAAL